MRGKPLGWATSASNCVPRYKGLWSRRILSSGFTEGGGRISMVDARGAGRYALVPWNGTSASAGGIAWDSEIGPSIGKQSSGAYWSHSYAPIGDFKDVTCVFVFKTGAASGVGVIASANSADGNNGWRLNYNSTAVRFTLGGRADYATGLTVAADTWYVATMCYRYTRSPAFVAVRALHSSAVQYANVAHSSIVGDAANFSLGGTKGLSAAFSPEANRWNLVGVFRGHDKALALRLVNDPFSWAVRRAAVADAVSAAPSGGRIMASMVGAGGLAGHGGLAGYGGGLAG